VDEAPFFARAFRRSRDYADKRGTGLSDHTAEFGAFEDRVDDIVAVMASVGWGRAVVGGMSEGGPLAIRRSRSSASPERHEAPAMPDS
jgi:pimeloyl-ACP methyl ester carboxylesterase